MPGRKTLERSVCSPPARRLSFQMPLDCAVLTRPSDCCHVSPATRLWCPLGRDLCRTIAVRFCAFRRCLSYSCLTTEPGSRGNASKDPRVQHRRKRVNRWDTFRRRDETGPMGSTRKIGHSEQNDCEDVHPSRNIYEATTDTATHQGTVPLLGAREPTRPNSPQANEGHLRPGEHLGLA